MDDCCVQVLTTRGLIDRDRLEIKDIITETANARVFATEWYLSGELVRRDVNVNILRGLEIAGTQEKLSAGS